MPATLTRPVETTPATRRSSKAKTRLTHNQMVDLIHWMAAEYGCWATFHLDEHENTSHIAIFPKEEVEEFEDMFVLKSFPSRRGMKFNGKQLLEVVEWFQQMKGSSCRIEDRPQPVDGREFFRINGCRVVTK